MADKTPKSPDSGPAATVTTARDSEGRVIEQPQIQVEIADNVTAFIDGKEVKPGKRVYLDAASALNLVQLGQAKITGSR